MIKKKHITLCFSLFLALSMFLGQLIPVTAEDNTVPQTEEQTTETEETPTPEPEVTEDVPDENPDDEPDSDPVPEEPEPTDNGDGDGEGDEEVAGENANQSAVGEVESSTPELNLEKTEGEITVKVHVPAGAFKVEPKLVVEKKPEGTEEFATAKEHVIQDQEKNLLVYDIRFELNGEEVEPAKEVQVEMYVNKEALSDDLVEDSLEVVHLKEVGETIKTEVVADASTSTDGIIELKDEQVKTKFTVDSFSTFTITWTTSSWGSSTQRAHITVHLVDENQNELTGTVKDIPAGSGDSVTISEKAPNISGYKYSRAYITVEGQNKDFTTISFKREGSFITGYTYSVVFNTEPETEIPYDEVSIKEDVYLEYIKSDSGTVKFDANGGNVAAPESVTKKIGESVELPNYSGTKNGYTFAGWAATKKTDSTTGYKVYKPGELFEVEDEEVTLYAVWNSSSTTTGHFFIRKDGKVPQEPGQYENSAYTNEIVVNNAVKNSFWTWDVEVTGKTITGNHLDNAVTAQLAKLPTDDQIKQVLPSFDSSTQYIQWYVQKYSSDCWHIDGVVLQKNLVTVTYDRNCNDLNVQPPMGYQVNKDTEITIGVSGKPSGDITTISRNGYTFVGWNTKADGSGEWYQNTNKYIVTENITFYAQWARDKVSFTLSHTVSGNMADNQKDFTFFLDITNEDGSHHNQDIQDAKGNVVLHYDENTNKHTVTLKHNESVSVELPLGTKVQVSQNPEEDYTTTHGENINSLTETGYDHAEITLPESTTVHFNNHKQAVVPSGLSDHDSYLSAFMLSAGTVIILLAMIIGVRRRMSAH